MHTCTQVRARRGRGGKRGVGAADAVAGRRMALAGPNAQPLVHPPRHGRSKIHSPLALRPRWDRVSSRLLIQEQRQSTRRSLFKADPENVEDCERERAPQRRKEEEDLRWGRGGGGERVLRAKVSGAATLLECARVRNRLFTRPCKGSWASTDSSVLVRYQDKHNFLTLRKGLTNPKSPHLSAGK